MILLLLDNGVGLIILKGAAAYLCRLDFRHWIKPQRGETSNEKVTLVSYVLYNLAIPNDESWYKS